jgi:hypothetical protein
MSTANIVKVTVDTPVTMQVTAVAEAKGNFGAQLRFDGRDGHGDIAVFEKLERADEQLRRAGLDRSTVIGRTITLYKENVTGAQGTFPALRIKADGTAPAAQPKANGAQPTSIGGPLPWEEAQPAPSTPGDAFEAISALYDRCFTRAMQFAQLAKITDQQAVVALAATLFIEANKRGIK